MTWSRRYRRSAGPLQVAASEVAPRLDQVRLAVFACASPFTSCFPVSPGGIAIASAERAQSNFGWGRWSMPKVVSFACSFGLERLVLGSNERFGVVTAAGQRPSGVIAHLPLTPEGLGIVEGASADSFYSPTSA
jgi:hypothetical protein